ncbi:MAG: GNAT family N-acetyltransferase [Opitutaceae bacterium]
MNMLVTERLLLRRLDPVGDASFVLELLNSPDWHRYIGDRGLRTVEQARGYLEGGPVAMYQSHGFGLLRVELREDATPIGLCGLIQRPTLPDVDLGFAYLERHYGCGYATEAARACLAYASGPLGLSRVLALVQADNFRSLHVLQKLGFAYEGVQEENAAGPHLLRFALTPSKAPPGATGEPPLWPLI